MNPGSTSPVITERMPVWEALSNFFLDTELDNADYQRIAEVLASSPYSIWETEEILRFEVYPVLIWNLRSVAGEWVGFNCEWLRDAIELRLNKRPRFRIPLLQWSMIRDHWESASVLIEDRRPEMANKTQHHKSDRAGGSEA